MNYEIIYILIETKLTNLNRRKVSYLRSSIRLLYLRSFIRLLYLRSFIRLLYLRSFIRLVTLNCKIFKK